MHSIVTIILFFVYLWGLGFTATYFLKNDYPVLEKNIMRFAIGMGVFPFLAILLNFLRVPLDWKIFLLISIAFPAYVLFKKWQKKEIRMPTFSTKITKETIAVLIIILISITSFYIYTKGAFSYPYLENEDPWGHSVGTKYVAVEKNGYDPDLPSRAGEVDPVLSYIDPYPPAYNILMGILHQTSPDVKWTLKFFNALIISAGFTFFYFFARRFVGSRTKALFSTFVLAAIPSYLSHFIWAHSLVITILFPTLYAFEQIIHDKRWMYISGWLVASIWVTQNFSQPLKFSSFILIYLIVRSVTHQKVEWRGFIALFSGIIGSLVWWGMMVKRHTLSGFLGYYVKTPVADAAAAAANTIPPTFFQSLLSRVSGIVRALTNPGGTASRAYGFKDFMLAHPQNQINNPIGIGVVLTILALVGIVYLLVKYRTKIVSKEQTWRAILLFWLVYVFWGVNGSTFPIPIARASFRVWMLMAIPIALIASETMEFLIDNKKNPLLWSGVLLVLLTSLRYVNKMGYGFPYKNMFFVISIIGAIIMLVITLLKKIGRVNINPNMIGLALIVFIGVFGILVTSGHQKYSVNTVIWPTSSSFSHPTIAFEYARFFETIPLGTKVFTYAPRDKLVVGLGGYSCYWWCDDIHQYRKTILYRDARELHSFMKRHGYEYFIINGQMDSRYFNDMFGENETATLLPQRYNEITQSGLFQAVYQFENVFFALRVV